MKKMNVSKNKKTNNNPNGIFSVQLPNRMKYDLSQSGFKKSKSKTFKDLYDEFFKIDIKKLKKIFKASFLLRTDTLSMGIDRLNKLKTTRDELPFWVSTGEFIRLIYYTGLIKNDDEDHIIIKKLNLKIKELENIIEQQKELLEIIKKLKQQ